MPLGDAISIQYTSPIFVGLLAFVIFKEKCGILFVVTSGVIIIAAFIIGRPTFFFENTADINQNDRIIGILLALLSSLSTGVTLITLRRLKNTPTSVINVWYALSGVVSATVITVIIDKLIWPENINIWLFIIASGFAATFNQLFYTLAPRFEKAGPISIARSFSLIFGYIFSITILHEKIQWTSLVGAALIFICVVTLGISRCINDRNNERVNQLLMRHENDTKNEDVNEPLMRHENPAPNHQAIN